MFCFYCPVLRSKMLIKVHRFSCKYATFTYGSCLHFFRSASRSESSAAPFAKVEPEAEPVEKVLREILTLKESYPFAKMQPVVPRKIVIDFSSPNVAKPFHAGHLRSTILGNFVGNLCEAAGHKVHRINYLGDWGTQNGIILAALERDGCQIDKHNSALKQLLEVYVRGCKLDKEDNAFNLAARSILCDIENGNTERLAVWKAIRDLSVQEYLKLYKRIGITFDEIVGESEYVAGAKKLMQVFSELLPGTNVADGIPLPDGSKTVFLFKSDDSTLYLSRDVAALLDRAERLNFDDMLYIVENGQHDHFHSLFQLAQYFKQLKDRNLVHVKFGRIRGLSTRKGQVVLLSDLLDQADAAMKIRIGRSKYARPKPEEFDQVAQTLALSVMIVNDFRQRRLMDYENAQVTLHQSEGNSGVFLQYVHARLFSLENNSGVPLNLSADFECLKEPECLELVAHLEKAPQTAQIALDNYEPSVLVRYLFDNGHLVNRALKVLRVKDQAAVGEARLAMFHASRLIARSFMKVLGIEPLDAM